MLASAQSAIDRRGFLLRAGGGLGGLALAHLLGQTGALADVPAPRPEFNGGLHHPARVRRIVTADYISVAIGLSVILAVLVNVVELLCTAGLPAVYTQILTLQQLPAWKNYLYLGLYILGYMFDDSLMVIAFVITLSHRKMREAEGRWLKLVSGVVMLALGALLLLRPQALAAL